MVAWWWMCVFVVACDSWRLFVVCDGLWRLCWAVFGDAQCWPAVVGGGWRWLAAAPGRAVEFVCVRVLVVVCMFC